MKMMGLQASAWWLGWWCSSALIASFSGSLFAVLLFAYGFLSSRYAGYLREERVCVAWQHVSVCNCQIDASLWLYFCVDNSAPYSPSLSLSSFTRLL
jgi:hypothetical protein